MVEDMTAKTNSAPIPDGTPEYTISFTRRDDGPNGECHCVRLEERLSVLAAPPPVRAFMLRKLESLLDQERATLKGRLAKLNQAGESLKGFAGQDAPSQG